MKKYEKPAMVVFNEGDATEWAVPQKETPPLSAVDCNCHCTMGQSRVCYGA